MRSMSSMASLNISLPQSLKDFVETQVADSGFSTPSEYVRALLRNDQKQRAEERLEALLLAGLDSGKPLEITPEYWEAKRKKLLAGRRGAGVHRSLNKAKTARREK